MPNANGCDKNMMKVAFSFEKKEKISPSSKTVGAKYIIRLKLFYSVVSFVYSFFISSNGNMDPYSAGGWRLSPATEGTLVSLIIDRGSHCYGIGNIYR